MEIGDKKDIAKNIVSRLDWMDDVNECIVDNEHKLTCYLKFVGIEGEYTPERDGRFSLRLTTNGIRSINNEIDNIHLSIVKVPKRKYNIINKKKVFVGYDINYITIKLEYV